MEQAYSSFFEDANPAIWCMISMAVRLKVWFHSLLLCWNPVTLPALYRCCYTCTGDKPVSNERKTSAEVIIRVPGGKVEGVSMSLNAPTVCERDCSRISLFHGLEQAKGEIEGCSSIA